MASEEDLPDSIVAGAFSGLKNTVAAERLQLGELERALNIDIDDAGQIRRRRGYTQIASGRFHSLFNTGTLLLAVKDGELGTLDSTYALTALDTVGDEPLSYAWVDGVTYYSSLTASGKIAADGTRSPWGELGGAGEWVSPVLTPTDTLGEIGGQYLDAPPLAAHIAAYNGRIYLANGKTVWATELYLYDRVDPDKNYIQFEAPVTMLASVDNGFYVGTERGLHFLSGTLSQGLEMKHISDAAVLPGSACRAPADRVHPAGTQAPVSAKQAVMFLTDAGVHAGFDGGECYNLTNGRVVFPGARHAAGLFRDQDGATSYVAVADSAGGPSSNTRIGDYVDAEIVRFSGG